MHLIELQWIDELVTLMGWMFSFFPSVICMSIECGKGDFIQRVNILSFWSPLEHFTCVLHMNIYQQFECLNACHNHSTCILPTAHPPPSEKKKLMEKHKTNLFSYFEIIIFFLDIEYVGWELRPQICVFIFLLNEEYRQIRIHFTGRKRKLEWYVIYMPEMQSLF